jgi:hypothetical protein
LVTPYEGADGNGSGVIDQGDYVVWRARFGKVPGPLAPPDVSPPPEPGAALAAALIDDATVGGTPAITDITNPPMSGAHEAVLRPAHSTLQAMMRPVAQLKSLELALVVQPGRSESQRDATIEPMGTRIVAHDVVFASWQNNRASDMGLDDALVSSGLSKDE